MTAPSRPLDVRRRVGAIAIGRNEGERLRRCLTSLRAQCDTLVYVDSGSTDDSVAIARSLGVHVVDLDTSIPFTAARARNAGFDKLREVQPTVEYAQFVDGDMEVIEDWIAAGAEVLDTQREVVAVCGWRRERNPEASVYNRICDVEWRMGGVGPMTAFGGDIMFRVSSLLEVGGYDPTVIAAEDDELGVRLRARGGVLLRIDRPSTLHDADMHALGQWWTRAKRCGHAYAQVSSMHGSTTEKKFVREVNRAWLFGAAVPTAAVALALPTLGLSTLLAGIYPLNAVRIALGTRRRGFSWEDSVAWGASCAFSSFPQAVGIAKFHLDRFRGKRPEIIEHKGTKK